MSRFITFVLILCGGVITACAEAPKGAEEETPADGKFDSVGQYWDHGALNLFGNPDYGTLTATDRFHSWTFTLTDSAQLVIRTAEAWDGEVDTVLYLYRKGTNGWGRHIARNDDAYPYLFSELEGALQAGEYRAVVKGYDTSVTGAFALTATCDGAGCACRFGNALSDLLEGSYQMTSERWLVAGTSLTGMETSHVLQAVRIAVPTAYTLPEAYAAVDQHGINQWQLTDPATGAKYTVYAYQLGGEVYGAVYPVGGWYAVATVEKGAMSCVP